MLAVPFIIVYLYVAIAYGCATNFIPSVMNYAAIHFKYICTEIQRFDEDYKSLNKKEVEERLKKILKDYQRTLRWVNVLSQNTLLI